MIEFLRPIAFSEDDLGFDAIAKVQTGGHFFGEAHTLERYETAFYRPMLSDWSNHGAWQAAGDRTRRSSGPRGFGKRRWPTTRNR